MENLQKGIAQKKNTPPEMHASYIAMESKVVRIRSPYKTQRVIQLTFLETPEAIAAIELVLELSVPDQNHHCHSGRYSLKLKFFPKTPTGYLHTSSLPARSGLFYPLQLAPNRQK